MYLESFLAFIIYDRKSWKPPNINPEKNDQIILPCCAEVKENDDLDVVRKTLKQIILKQGLADFSIEGHMVNILVYAGHSVSVMTTQFCHSCAKAAQFSSVQLLGRV